DRVAARRLGRSPVQWLLGVLQVDDGQPVETEHDLLVLPGAGLVRTAVAHAPHGRVNCRTRGFRVHFGGTDQANQTAHGCRSPLVVGVDSSPPWGQLSMPGSPRGPARAVPPRDCVIFGARRAGHPTRATSDLLGYAPLGRWVRRPAGAYFGVVPVGRG